MSREFVISRLFDAPVERVWQAWTKPEAFGQWFGPRGFHSEVKRFELRRGGMLHSCLVSDKGERMWARFVYRDVEPEKRLAWEHSFSNAQGGITRHPGSASWPLVLITTLHFTAEGAGIGLTLRWVPAENTPAGEVTTFEAAIDGMNQGWTATFNQLEHYLNQEKNHAA